MVTDEMPAPLTDSSTQQQVFEHYLGEMEMSAEDCIPSGQDGVTSEKALDNLLKITTKLPFTALTALVSRFPSRYNSAALTPQDKLESGIKALLCGLWESSGRDWNAFAALVEKEVTATVSHSLQMTLILYI
jgi:hypothetical protein